MLSIGHISVAHWGRSKMSDPISVLVVEDEVLILMSIVDQLRDSGYRVYEAMDADSAIELLNAHSDIRLVFTDIDMPGSMNGLKLAAAVRHRWPPVKLIVTSGQRMVEITDMPDGSVFFSKPYGYDAVLLTMREMLSAV